MFDWLFDLFGDDDGNFDAESFDNLKEMGFDDEFAASYAKGEAVEGVDFDTIGDDVSTEEALWDYDNGKF